MRFLGLGLKDAMPDATALWRYRGALARAGAVEALFDAFDGHLREHGFLAMGGQIIDASIVTAPRQSNSRADNATIRRGETPPDWEGRPAKRRQKDIDARWTRKHGHRYFGYKNHISMDRRHKLVRRCSATHAARHDSGEIEVVLNGANTCSKVWADSAYRPARIEERLAVRGHTCCIHRRAARNHPLSAREQQGNATRSRVRAKMKIGMQNLTYIMTRVTHLTRVQASPP